MNLMRGRILKVFLTKVKKNSPFLGYHIKKIHCCPVKVFEKAIDPKISRELIDPIIWKLGFGLLTNSLHS